MGTNFDYHAIADIIHLDDMQEQQAIFLTIAGSSTMKLALLFMMDTFFFGSVMIK